MAHELHKYMNLTILFSDVKMTFITIISILLIASLILFLNRSRVSFAGKSSFFTTIKPDTLNTPYQRPIQENVLKINMHNPSHFNHSTTGRGRTEGQTMNWLDTPWKVDMRPQIFIPDTPPSTNTYERNDIETECCHNCGNHVLKNDKFCIFCGSRLKH